MIAIFNNMNRSINLSKKQSNTLLTICQCLIILKMLKILKKVVAKCPPTALSLVCCHNISVSVGRKQFTGLFSCLRPPTRLPLLKASVFFDGGFFVSYVGVLTQGFVLLCEFRRWLNNYASGTGNLMPAHGAVACVLP